MSATRARPDFVSSARGALDRGTTALAVLFFLSGFPALVYQLLWQRALFRIFGVNVESVTIVVTAFMVGLGLGSLAGGWLSTRPRLKLLPLLAIIEVLTALFGLFSLAIFEKVGDLALGLPLPVTAAVTLALVLVPTLLMGATLPLIVGELTRRNGNTGESMGLLYFVNTLGAGVACFAGAFLLFPFLGMWGSVLAAALLNLLVAAGAVAAHVQGLGGPAGEAGGTAPESAASATRAGARTGLALPLPGVLALAALGGFVSLSFEIFFFRVVSFTTGNSATAFACTLGAFLVGIALGSREAGALAAGGDAQRSGRSIVAALLHAAIAGFAFLPVVNLAAPHAGADLAVSLVFIAYVARCWGMLLPWLTHVGVAADGDVGRRVSWLYLANIVGSGAGSILTGFVLMQHLTMVGTAQLLLVLGLATTAVLWWVVEAPQARHRLRLAGAAAAGIAATLALPSLTPLMLERLQFASGPAASRPFTRVIENRSGIVAVDAEGHVWGHGMYDGSFNTTVALGPNGVLRPYALSLFHPRPRHVLVIGLASGAWSRVVVEHPDVETVTIVEINPAYLDIIRERPEVAPILSSPKVRLVIDDGRRWLKLNPDARFDAIVSNTTWHFRANVTNLMSAEFIALAQRHLAPGGFFFYNTTSSLRAQRTACLASPHALRYTNHMVVANGPIPVDFQRWRGVLERYRIDGRPVLDGAAMDLLMSFEADLAASRPEHEGGAMEGCRTLLARSQGLAPFTDDNMGSEWRHRLGLK